MSRRSESKGGRGYAWVALWSSKSLHNLGTAYRSCQIFNVAVIQLANARFRRQASDTLKTWRHLPIIEHDELIIPHDCVPVAIEIKPGSRSLPAYVHPERALYVFGPEDGSLPARICARCRDVVQIPGDHCLNLASAVSIVLYDRVAKMG